MKIAVGADHGGYPLNERVIEELRAMGHEIIDFGTHDGSQPDDYPDYALQIGKVVQSGQAEIGILICGSGVGAAVAANKLHGVRAALCGDTYSGHQSRRGIGIGDCTGIRHGKVHRRRAPSATVEEGRRDRRDVSASNGRFPKPQTVAPRA